MQSSQIFSTSLLLPDGSCSEATSSHTSGEFTDLVNKHRSMLLASVFKLTKNRQVAEDIVQDTFLKCWEKRTAVRKDNIGGWLYRVAWNLTCKYMKRESARSRIYKVFQNGNSFSLNEAEEKLQQKENKGLLTETYKLLPDKQLKVFQLSNVAGLSRNEIAHYLNISPNTVRNHLARATRFIKENIQCACLILFFSAICYIFFNSGGTKVDLRDFIEVQGRVKKHALTEVNNRNENAGSVIGYMRLQDM